jgi:pimeloyl-ACP methyl ester carboxylesterase
MATIAIIHGGADSGLSWGPAAAHLRALGHEPVPVDLPIEDPKAGWNEHADTVAAAVRGKPNIVVVAHSLGGFTAPLVCERVPVDRLIFVAAMIPTPGALASAYWTDNGYTDAAFDEDSFFHDLSPEAIALAKRAERSQCDASVSQPSPLKSWPAIPTHYLLATNDRCFPAATTRRVVRALLNIAPDEIETGHLPYLARPRELAERINGYLR